MPGLTLHDSTRPAGELLAKMTASSKSAANNPLARKGYRTSENARTGSFGGFGLRFQNPPPAHLQSYRVARRTLCVGDNDSKAWKLCARNAASVLQSACTCHELRNIEYQRICYSCRTRRRGSSHRCLPLSAACWSLDTGARTHRDEQHTTKTPNSPYFSRSERVRLSALEQCLSPLRCRRRNEEKKSKLTRLSSRPAFAVG
ncbi:hypothetical protein BC629DRAFT_225628 [Irpex lacteus]|nr:hypothetical protein BC629DRAFT_225628 [Irpex lacteus]